MFELMRKKANVPKTIRFTEELNEKLRKVAKENNVSFNSLVLQCCEYAINNMKK